MITKKAGLLSPTLHLVCYSKDSKLKWYICIHVLVCHALCFSLIRQGYLEIALVYLYSSGMIGRQVSATDLQSDSEGEGSLASRPSSQRRSGKRWKVRAF